MMVVKKSFKKKSVAQKKSGELQKLFDSLRKGDEVVVWKLDRLGRSLPDLVAIVNQLQDQEVGFRCIQDSHIDTTTPQGKLIFHIFASLADFERDIIRERTKAGLVAARARGRIGGRPKGLNKSAEQKAMLAEMLYSKGELTTVQICEQLNIARSTLYRYLKLRGVSIDGKS